MPTQLGLGRGSLLQNKSVLQTKVGGENLSVGGEVRVMQKEVSESNAGAG